MKLFVFVLVTATVVCANTSSSEEENKAVEFEDDPLTYIKNKISSFLESILDKDNFELSEDVKVSKNSYRSNEVISRSNGDYEDRIEEYLKGHDVTFQLPLAGGVTVAARNLDNGEIDMKLNFGTGVQEARKSKLKKIFIPIMVFVLLKAITLVPLALGILGLKAWNSLQLSFLSFVVSIGLAIFQLCKKLAADSAAPQIAAHGGWEPAPYAARSFDDGYGQDEFEGYGQQMAYSAYVR